MAFSATAVLKANTSDFDKGMKSSEGSSAAFGAEMLVVGAAVLAGAAALVKFTFHQAELGDTIAKTSKQLGISQSEFQRLGFAMKISGGSSAALVKGIKNVNVALEQMSQGKSGEDVGEALRAIGLSAAALSGVGTEDRLGLIADKLKAIRDPARKSALTMQLFGKRAGAEIKPLLDQGAEGIRALGDEAEALGGVLSELTTRQMEELVDANTRLETAFAGVSARIASKFIPNVQAGTEALEKMAPFAEEVAGAAADQLNNMADSALGIGELGAAFGDLLEATTGSTISFTDLFRVYAGFVTGGVSEAAIAFWENLPNLLNKATIQVKALNVVLGNTETILITRIPSSFDRLTDTMTNFAASLNEVAVGMNDVNRQTTILENAAKVQKSLDKSFKKKRGKRRKKKPTIDELVEGAQFEDTEGLESGVKAELINEEILAIERRIEVKAIEGEQTLLLEQERFELLEERALVEMDFEEFQAIQHEATLFRAEEQQDAAKRTADIVEAAKAREKKAQKDAARTIISAGQGVIGIHNQLGQTVAMAAANAGASAKKQEEIERKFLGTGAILLGAVELVKSAVSFAEFNFPQGALHLAASILGFAQGGIILSGGLPGKSSAGGGGGGGGARPSAAPTPASKDDRPQIPTSPSSVDAQQDGEIENGGGGGGSTQIFNLQGAIIGSDPELFTQDFNKTIKKGNRLAS